jgi:phospholipid N-methyltransferase
MGKIDFFKTFIKDRDVASIIPTSIRCVKKVCNHIDFTKDFVLVEYGPGDGAFTKFLLEKMSPGSRLILIEANEDFAQHLKETIDDSRVTVHNILAGNVESVIEEKDMGNIDYVLSGIPFSFLDKDRKRIVLQATKTILKKGGKFLAYQTSGHLKKPVMEVFGNYDIEMEMLNIPPYLIYDVINKESTNGHTTENGNA